MVSLEKKKKVPLRLMKDEQAVKIQVNGNTVCMKFVAECVGNITVYILCNIVLPF